MAKDNTCYNVILGILSLRPGSGYDIKKTIGYGVGYIYKVSNGQIYPVLKKLMEENHVTCLTEKNESKPERKTYTITESGLSVFREWLEAPSFANESEMLLKLYFGSIEPIRHNIELMTRIKETKEKKLSAYSEIADKFDTAARAHIPNYYSFFTLRFGQIMTQAYIDWSQEVINTLQKLDQQ